MATDSIISNRIKLVSFSKAYSVIYNTGVDNLISVPSGYSAVGVVRYDTGNAAVAVMAVKENSLTLTNLGARGAEQTGTCSGYVMCVRSAMIA